MSIRSRSAVSGTKMRYERAWAVTHPAPKRPSDVSQAVRGPPTTGMMPLFVPLVSGRASTQALGVGPAPLFSQAPLARLGRGRRRAAPALALEPAGDRLGEALERQLAVSPLAALVLSDCADNGADAIGKPALVRVRQRRRRLHVEEGLHARLRLLHVLAARAARTRETKLDLAERELDGLPVADPDA